MDNTKECPVKSCLGKWLCGAIPVFIFLFAAGYVINHIWLMPLYEATASTWRPMGEMENMMPWLIAYYAVLALGISALFCKVKKAKMQACAVNGSMPPEADCRIGGPNCPIKHGICFGTAVGLLLGAANAGFYIWLPIPGELAVKWFIGWLGQGIGSGLILALLCHYKNRKCNGA